MRLTSALLVLLLGAGGCLSKGAAAAVSTTVAGAAIAVPFATDCTDAAGDACSTIGRATPVMIAAGIGAVVGVLALLEYGVGAPPTDAPPP